MCGKSFERYSRYTATREEYKERIQQRNVRMMLAGTTRHPKYPDMEFKPESALYGMQDLGILYSLRIMTYGFI